MDACLSVLLISSELWVLIIINQLFALTFMQSCVLVVLGFLVHPDLQLPAEESLSRLQVTSLLVRTMFGERSGEAPILCDFDASAVVGLIDIP